MLKDPGYLKVTGMGGQKKEAQLTEEQIHAISSLKKGMRSSSERLYDQRWKQHPHQNDTIQVP